MWCIYAYIHLHVYDCMCMVYIYIWYLYKYVSVYMYRDRESNYSHGLPAKGFCNHLARCQGVSQGMLQRGQGIEVVNEVHHPESPVGVPLWS